MPGNDQVPPAGVVRSVRSGIPVMRAREVVVAALLCTLAGCTGHEPPSGPHLLIAPSFEFTPGRTLSYTRQNFDANGNPTAFYFHDVEVLDRNRTTGGYTDAATVKVSTRMGSLMRLDTVAMAVEGGRLMVYDLRAQVPGRVPPLSAWNTLIDLDPGAGPDTLLAFDSTFTLTMASGHILRDRVHCAVGTRFAREDQIPGFGAPFINCFVFTRTVSYDESVDTSGVLLFQGPVIALLDSVWFADGIGPVRWTTRGSALGVDSLGLPFSLASLQVVHTPSSHDSYEVHYARVNGRDSLSLRESLYYFPPASSSLTVAYAKNF